MSIEENVAAGKAAEAAVGLLCDEAMQLRPEAFVHFWRRVLRLLKVVVPEEQWPKQVVQQPVVPMTSSERAQFELTRCPFKEHKGEYVDEVPLSYLEWLDSQPDFRQQLRRYLASRQVQQHMVVIEPGDDESEDE